MPIFCQWIKDIHSKYPLNEMTVPDHIGMLYTLGSKHGTHTGKTGRKNKKKDPKHLSHDKAIMVIKKIIKSKKKPPFTMLPFCYQE